MKIYYSSHFAIEYKKLPLKIKKMAEEKEFIFRENPFDIRLKTHKLKGGMKGFLSFSINRKNRIIFELINQDVAWCHSIGDHSIYKLWD